MAKHEVIRNRATALWITTSAAPVLQVLGIDLKLQKIPTSAGILHGCAKILRFSHRSRSKVLHQQRAGYCAAVAVAQTHWTSTR